MKDNILDKKLEYANLFSFYYKLLTEKQIKILNLYFFEDLSLTEIAGQSGSSKQAVSDCILKSTQKLDQLEDKLHLQEKFNEINNSLTKIKQIINDRNCMIDTKSKHEILSSLNIIEQKEEN